MNKLYVLWLFVGAVVGVLLFVFGAALTQFQLAFGCIVLVLIFVTTVNLYGEAKTEQNDRLDVQTGIDKEHRQAQRDSTEEL